MSETRLPLLPIAATIIALGLIIGGWLLGDGLTRARHADRAVTVRGLAEQDVTADLATWTISTSAVGNDLGALQAKADTDGNRVMAFLEAQGFSDAEIESGGISVSQYVDGNGRPNITIRRRIQLRTTKVMEARTAFSRQAELMRQGIVFDSDQGGMIYSFTRLNDVKPPMIAAATKNAREGAEQFAKDSGSGVGDIKSAAQGYFSIIPRDGDSSGSTASSSPYQKVRVVTTIDFYLD
ncbi:SIMPL domain-containing protein [Polymorphobacter glacialis]|uniref:SIMPL domain-containing protein n=1 Tax=Sandarakinorhabdus glacialis TaxID=1614636 RepID=A0A916ZQ20_9SPHN|nr:SIMPL domain-containing protein [Polymorphobacter glacialis]GGE08370.1 SIMPL domain-containing protein [Polymorphobacter glacialis]